MREDLQPWIDIAIAVDAGQEYGRPAGGGNGLKDLCASADMKPAALGVAFAWACSEGALPFMSAPMAVTSAVKRSCSVIAYALAAV